MLRTLLITILIIFALAGGIIWYLMNWGKYHHLRAATLNIGDMEREFSYYLPDDLSPKPKLVFVLHGSGGTGEKMEMISGHQFDKLAKKYKNLILVYPQAFKGNWNDCRKLATYESKKRNVDDLAFFSKMLEFFIREYHVDPANVFVAGFSNGGQMCYKLAKAMPDKFKGFAAISATLPKEDNDDCIQKNKAVSMLIINGTADPICPYNGGHIAINEDISRGELKSAEETLNYWATLAKCDTAHKTVYTYPDIHKEDHSSAVKYTYSSTESGKEVGLIKVINGGHIIPNPTYQAWPVKMGNQNKDINAPELIVNFFLSLH